MPSGGCAELPRRGEAVARLPHSYVRVCVCSRAHHTGTQRRFYYYYYYKKCAVPRVVLRVVVCVVGCVVNGRCALYLSGFCCVVGCVVTRAAVCAVQRVAIWWPVWYRCDEPAAHLAPFPRKWLGDLRG